MWIDIDNNYVFMWIDIVEMYYKKVFFYDKYILNNVEDCLKLWM